MSTPSHSPSTEALMDDPEPGSSWFISVAGIVVLVVFFVALAVIYFRAEQSEFDRKVVDRPIEPLVELKNAQNLLLAESGEYVDPDTGERRRRIPIEDAMRQIAAQQGSR